MRAAPRREPEAGQSLLLRPCAATPRAKRARDIEREGATTSGLGSEREQTLSTEQKSKIQ